MENIREQMEKLEISSEAINEVLFVAKRMDDKGLVNSFAGNISTKKDGKIYITPTGQNICEANGWDVGGVVHSHSKILTAFSMACMDVETEALPEMMGNFHKIPCVPYGAPGTKYILTMAEPYLADGYRIVLLGNHGSLAVGKTVEDAMNVVEACESIAEQVLITKYILKSEAPLDRDEVARFFDIYKENREKRKK